MIHTHAWRRLARKVLDVAFVDLQERVEPSMVDELLTFFRGDTLEPFCVVAGFDFELVKREAEGIIKERGLQPSVKKVTIKKDRKKKAVVAKKDGAEKIYRSLIACSKGTGVSLWGIRMSIKEQRTCKGYRFKLFDSHQAERA